MADAVPRVTPPEARDAATYVHEDGELRRIEGDMPPIAEPATRPEAETAPLLEAEVVPAMPLAESGEAASHVETE